MDDRITAEAVDYIGIRRLQSSYADIVTRRAWDEFETIFLPDARIVVDRQAGEPHRLDGAPALAEFISKAIGHMDFFQFVVLNTIVDIRDEEAAGRMYMCEIRHDSRAGHTMSYGLYKDKYRKIDGKWWFADRLYRVMGRSQTTDYNVFAMSEADFRI